MPLNDQKANAKLATTLANKYSIFFLPSKVGIGTSDMKLHVFIGLFMLCGSSWKIPLNHIEMRPRPPVGGQDNIY